MSVLKLTLNVASFCDRSQYLAQGMIVFSTEELLSNLTANQDLH